MKFYELLIFTCLDKLSHHIRVLGKISKETCVSNIFSLPARLFFSAKPDHSLLSQQTYITHFVPNGALRGSLLCSQSAEAGQHPS